MICREGDAAPPGTGVAAIGNFDGVHLGHRRLAAVARDIAARSGGRPAVLTFEPHPREFFRPDLPVFRLTDEATKVRLLGALGIEVVFVRRFDASLAALTAESFVRDLLVGELGLSAAVVGTNFRFGRGRAGTTEALADLGRAAGMDVAIEPAVTVDGLPVSSSRIRDALEAGDVATANRLLDHRWFVSGTVIHGAKRGRTLGYPTANVALAPSCRLRHGIYAVRAATGDGAVRDGVASFGRRPTFDDGAPLLETFLFDFAGDLYGRRLDIELLGWIRGEERFASVDELLVAMDRDSGTARALISAASGAAVPSAIG